MTTPPGHAMTAQAGAVAYIKQSTLDKLPGCKYIEAAVFPDAGEDRTPLYTTPPAAVSVEALEGLAAEWEAEAAALLGKSKRAANHVAAGGLNTRAAQLRKLIKERSNG